MATPSDQDLLPAITRLWPRLWANVQPDESGCWLWTGALALNGYGTRSLRVDGRNRSVRAHRAIFMLTHGRPIVVGMTLHHTCHHLACVNPAHLVEMSGADNTAADATGGASIQERTGPRGVGYAVLFREDVDGKRRQRSRTFRTREEADNFAEMRLSG